MQMIKRIHLPSLVLGLLFGAGGLALFGAATAQQSATNQPNAAMPAGAPGKYQLSRDWTDGNGTHGVYQIDTATGQVMEIIGNVGRPVYKP